MTEPKSPLFHARPLNPEKRKDRFEWLEDYAIQRSQGSLYIGDEWLIEAFTDWTQRAIDIDGHLRRRSNLMTRDLQRMAPKYGLVKVDCGLYRLPGYIKK